jgi:regulator of protease activity HflC (stomatin/prohibitin superfamily)
MNRTNREASSEQSITTFNGIFMLLVLLGLIASTAFLLLSRLLVPGIVSAVVLAIVAAGFFMLQPNEAAAVMLFGDYAGTDRNAGLRWYWPWYSRRKVSLRARNLNGERLKVNDKRGNPIEIAAVVVWRVEDTAQALFDVEDFEVYVRLQSESALRHLASNYNYDEGEEYGTAHREVTLRAGADTVAEALQRELQLRIALAGLEIVEAKLTHLAYAPEIAGAMLRRQQAEAVISARAKIVIGAVSMVEMALKSLSEKNVVELDGERRAAMVSNLMVVLCSERDTQPIVNTGTLYN